eukprot:CAMPEP_0179180884 /NCGR_PEP_ID=MMETSP0796-20121207/89565_1 /TAXON_ID=73915 /ORGANISM="Pyrodinium bahamense, Strain pbaha01" /LENGTH=82 /DNA_ID=CAMNT_0020884619 /DNA_START=1 /DNA_END=246 /DNA_ORIENTATION=-
MSARYGEGPADEERQAFLLRLHRQLRRRQQQQEQLARIAAGAAEPPGAGAEQVANAAQSSPTAPEASAGTGAGALPPAGAAV